MPYTRDEQGYRLLSKDTVEKLRTQGLKAFPRPYDPLASSNEQETNPSGTSPTRPALSTVQNKRDEIEIRKLDRELARMDAEDTIAARESSDARRAQAFAEKQAAYEMRNRQSREREERKAGRARVAWESQIISRALASLPHDVPPSVKVVASELVREALASLSPDHFQQVVESAVSGAVTRALEPWQRRMQSERVIAEMERKLPWDMRVIGAPTEWQIRYRAAAEGAIGALPVEAPLSQIRATASSEAAKLATEFERSHVEERHRRTCAQLLAGVELRVLESESRRCTRSTAKGAGPAPRWLRPNGAREGR